VAKLGRSLDSAVASYNQTVSSLEARVLVTARKLTDLEVTDADIAEPAQVERAPRTVAAPELVASAADSLIALHELNRAERSGERAGGDGRGESRATVTG
jgi:DNA recombination protein RmuC